jgi:hypothetical protein
VEAANAAFGSLQPGKQKTKSKINLSVGKLKWSMVAMTGPAAPARVTPPFTGSEVPHTLTRSDERERIVCC